MIRKFSGLSVVCTLVVCHGGVLAAAPVSIDGTLGAEWAGVSAVTVAHDLTALTGNFGTPQNITQGASYSIQVRSDADFYYVGLKITGDAGSSAGNFANLYFDTDPPANNGSDVGFEVTNNRYFIAGGAGPFDASAFLTFDSASHPGTIELAIANSFFTAGPLAGIAYPNGYPPATGNVVLRLSQSFGYSVAGGSSYGPTRLGSASVVPEPEAYGLALAGMGVVGVAMRRRRRAG